MRRWCYARGRQPSTRSVRSTIFGRQPSIAQWFREILSQNFLRGWLRVRRKHERGTGTLEPAFRGRSGAGNPGLLRAEGLGAGSRGTETAERRGIVGGRSRRGVAESGDG